MIRRLLVLVLSLCSLGLAAHAHGPGGHAHTPPWQAASGWPDRIVVTLPGPPQSSFAVTWRTDAGVTETFAEIAPATDDARFDHAAKAVAARTEQLDLEGLRRNGEFFEAPWNTGLGKAHYHSVTFTGLQPDTLYAYRVRGAHGAWSEWFQIRTAPASGPVKFIYVGDAQNGVLSHWSRLIRASFAHAPDARFILHAGDLVNRASRDYEWAEWFKAVGFIHGMIPAVPVAGNHEYAQLGLGDRQTDRLLSILWRPQFALPEEAGVADDLKEAVYQIRYSPDVHLFVLSTQHADIASQARWLDAALRASDARWRIVSMHHPIFSSGGERDSPDRRAVLLPVLERHKVDLVLQGHDHTYARGAIGQTPERLSFTEAGGDVSIMFVNSVSGPKQYDFKPTGWDDYADEGVKLLRQAENTQFFQVIEIDGDTLTYEARTATGALYDAFAMQKGQNGAKTVTRGAAATIDERAFDGTAPYDGTTDLQ